MLELLQICGRTLKREELRNRKTRGDAAASWPALLDDESLSGIVEAEREVIKTMETLGMLPLFTSSNILRANENGDIIFINPGMETTLVDISFEPEENECMTADELLDLDNEETNEQSYTHSLTDLAASSAQAAHMAKRTDETIEGATKSLQFLSGRYMQIRRCYFQTTINNTLDSGTAEPGGLGGLQPPNNFGKNFFFNWKITVLLLS